MASPKKPKAVQASKRDLEEFAERYETYANIYGDPVQVIFEVMMLPPDRISPDTRLRAAEMLMSYRYPRLKALEQAPPAGPQLSIQIIQAAPATPPPSRVIDITPAAGALE